MVFDVQLDKTSPEVQRAFEEINQLRGGFAANMSRNNVSEQLANRLQKIENEVVKSRCTTSIS